MLIFDFDGVIVNSIEESCVFSYAASVDTCPFKNDLSQDMKEQFYEERHKIRDIRFDSIWGKILGIDIDVDTYLNRFSNLRELHIGTPAWLSLYSLYPGVSDFFNQLDNKVFVCTARDPESTHAILSHFDLSKHVEEIVSTHPPKTNSVLEILKKTGSKPKDTHFIDDNIENLYDVLSTGVNCHQAGWGFCGEDALNRKDHISCLLHLS